MKKRVSIMGVCMLLFAAFLLSACAPIVPPTESDPTTTQNDPTTVTNPTTTEASGTSEPTGESTGTTAGADLGYYVPEHYPEISTKEFVTQAPTLPIPEDNASKEEWYAFFYGLLKSYRSYYNLALSSTYETPKDIKMSFLLECGVLGSHPEFTDEEKAFLTGKIVFEMDTYKIPVSDIDALLETYFGITFEDCTNQAPDRLIYFDRTDCIYTNGVAHYPAVKGIVDYSVSEDGVYRVRYACGYFDISNYEVTLQRVDNYFKVISNLPCEVNS